MSLPKMYCLTCSQMPWRTQAATKRFKEAGLEVELVEGIHGATVGVAPTLDHFDAPRHRISSGKLGITFSKMLLWQLLLERPEPYALCLENDVTFCPDFAAELAASMAALPADWEVVHVGHCCTADKPTIRVNERVAEIRHPFCCHAVLWTKRAAQVALREFRKASWGTPSDILLARTVYPQLRHYTFTPPLAFQADIAATETATGRWDTIPGWFDYAQIYNEALDRAARSPTPSVFVEVGSWKGRSTAFMAEEIKRRLLPVDFYAVDTWQGMPYGGLDEEVRRDFGGDLFPTFWRNMSRAGVINYVRPLQLPSVEVAARFAAGTVDFVFIDGDHQAAAVMADITAWLPTLKPGGVIAGHDIDIPAVRQAVRQALPRARVWERCWIADPHLR